MKLFSVLTVTKRQGWEKIAEESMLRQTLPPLEWIVVTEEELQITRYPATIIKAPEKVRVSNLNASLNAGLRAIDKKSNYVIFYQDFIELPPDCFEKLMDLSNHQTFVTTCTPNYDGSDDNRYTGKNVPRSCRPEEWETNVAAAPMKFIRDLGGYEEEYDNGWAWDNVNVAQRAAMLGARFKIDESNRPKLYPHEQLDKKTLPLNVNRHSDTMKAIRAYVKPIKLNYLKK